MVLQVLPLSNRYRCKYFPAYTEGNGMDTPILPFGQSSALKALHKSTAICMLIRHFTR